ncbi:MAG: hypothetical protein HEQ34_13400 [Sphingorhabdus sp.]|uniref:hypothetical protein n=1 Tax=Sphingorhabdus sp. TaxID=1902408 RepID=UPI0025DB448E|nr:hypothetical protein [Sphingorhabdus sp.]MCO4092930.1 hypothetical protein [Sphingorhabdus sp.]
MSSAVGDDRYCAAISVLLDWFDNQFPSCVCFQSAPVLVWIAQRTFSASLAMARQFRGINSEQSDANIAAPQRVAVGNSAVVHGYVLGATFANLRISCNA